MSLGIYMVYSVRIMGIYWVCGKLHPDIWHLASLTWAETESVGHTTLRIWAILSWHLRLSECGIRNNVSYFKLKIYYFRLDFEGLCWTKVTHEEQTSENNAGRWLYCMNYLEFIHVWLLICFDMPTKSKKRLLERSSKMDVPDWCIIQPPSLQKEKKVFKT